MSVTLVTITAVVTTVCALAALLLVLLAYRHDKNLPADSEPRPETSSRETGTSPMDSAGESTLAGQRTDSQSANDLTKAFAIALQGLARDGVHYDAEMFWPMGQQALVQRINKAVQPPLPHMGLFMSGQTFNYKVSGVDLATLISDFEAERSAKKQVERNFDDSLRSFGLQSG